MSTKNNCFDVSAHLTNLEYVRYFSRQLITAEDMTAEQEYFREKFRRHNRYLHGWGVVCGCEVVAVPQGKAWEVQVCPGYVITPQGDEILIPKAVSFDLVGDWRQASDPCARPMPCVSPGASVTGDENQKVYLAVCYAECNSRPVRVQPAGCGCDEAACEYSRIRESFELVLLDSLPESHKQAVALDQEWETYFDKLTKTDPEDRAQLPACRCTYDDNCVVLASITLPVNNQTKLNEISYEDRRVLYSVSTFRSR